MNTQDFWRLMDETHRRSGGGTARQAKLLISDLAVQGPEAVLAFEGLLNHFMGQAYDRRHSPESGFGQADCFSDDGLEYFIYAIIAAGEEVYYKVLGASNPIEVEAIHDKCGGGEQIGWVPRYAYYRATGKPHPMFAAGDYDEGDEYLIGDEAEVIAPKPGQGREQVEV